MKSIRSVQDLKKKFNGRFNEVDIFRFREISLKPPKNWSKDIRILDQCWDYLPYSQRGDDSLKVVDFRLMYYRDYVKFVGGEQYCTLEPNQAALVILTK